MLRLTGALVMLCLGAATAAAQGDAPATLDEAPVVVPVDSTAAALARGNTVILPIVAYTPDTGLALGALALRFFYLDPPGDDTRPSTLSPVLIYTFKNQIIAFLGTDLNWGGGRWHAGLVPGYQKFPDDFYGIGRDAPADPLEKYTPEQFSFAAMIEREVLGELRAGVGYRALRHQLLKTEEGGVLASGGVPGTGRTVLSAPGLQAAWDTRDNTWSPRRGLWTVASATFYRKGWGSDVRFTETVVDLRGYVPVGEAGTLAGQVRYHDADGDVPFFALPRLGGDSGLRGYPGGRFLDHSAAWVRGEWRTGPVWKRFGAVVFAAVGDVAPKPGALTTAGGLTTFGAGLRWTVDPKEKVNLRMDFGFGRNDGGFYLSLGEAF